MVRSVLAPRSSRHRLAALATGAVALALVLGQAIGSGGALAASTSTARAASGSSQRVIVMLRDRLTATPESKRGNPARVSKATSEQKAVLARLAGPAPQRVTHLALGNAFTATVTAAQAAALAADPAVASVTPDAKITATPSPAAAPVGAGSAQSAQSPKNAQRPKAVATPKVATSGPFAVCPADPSKPLLEPEALTSIHAANSTGAPSAQDLTTGAGVKVAYIADGIDPNNPDFIRPDGQHVIVDYKDFSGDGPDAPSGGAEAFGDASSIAAQGTVSHDLSLFVNPAYALPSGCNIRILGVAPGASIVALKAGGEFLTDSSILQALDYAVNVARVDVINQSFGLNQFPDSSSRSVIQQFDDAAVAAGVTVTASTGDGGVTGTIGNPATDPNVISAGASTDNRLYAQTGYAMAGLANGTWVSDNISALSSAGLTMGDRTPDITAPGEGNWAVCEPGFANCINFHSPPQPTDVQSFGGTSESAPLTAGVAALVISAYRSTHGGASPTPAVVKQLITSTASDLGLPAYEQGSGLLNARGAVEAALTYPGATGVPAGVSSHIALSTNQIQMVGNPGTTHSASVKVTNVGDSALTVKTGARTFSTFGTQFRTPGFDANSLPTRPYATTGAPWAVEKKTFTVPAGTDRLLTRLAWQGRNADGSQTVVRLSLIGPDGALVANSRPQGGAATPSYANVDVRQPQAGTWTAVFYSPAGSAGYDGPLKFQADYQHIVAAGQVTPASVHLAAGQTTSVRISLTTPSSGGDADYSMTFADSAGSTTTASVVMRALIPITHGSGRFTGTITGGNARGVTPAQTFSYAFDVPSGRKDLGTSLTLTKGPGDLVDTVLIDPNGELADVNSNFFQDAAGDALLSQGIQTYDAAPIPGRWHLVVVVQNPVTGTEIQQTVLGQIKFNSVHAGAPGLPASASTKLKAGTPTTVQLHFVNTGVEPLTLGVDARGERLKTMTAVPTQGTSSYALPQNPADAPVYTVPPDSTRLSVTATSSVAAQLEMQGSANGIDIMGAPGTTSTTTVSQPNGGISRGIWFTIMQEVGPFTTAQPSGTATQSAQVRTLTFDRAVTSATGDPFLNGVDASAPATHLVIVNPGASVTIPVTITPSGAKGSVVTGHLNLVTRPNQSTGFVGLPTVGTGSVVAQLPYSYTIG